jgi:hypothetical protein
MDEPDIYHPSNTQITSQGVNQLYNTRLPVGKWTSYMQPSYQSRNELVIYNQVTSQGMNQLYISWRGQITFNDMIMPSAFTRPTRLVGRYLVLANWNNNPRVDMSLHSDTLLKFRANQSLLFLLNAACLP